MGVNAFGGSGKQEHGWLACVITILGCNVNSVVIVVIAAIVIVVLILFACKYNFKI